MKTPTTAEYLTGHLIKIVLFRKMGKWTFIFSTFCLVFLGCNNECDYASYDFIGENKKRPMEGFQIQLHSMWDNRIELIGSNYITKEFWIFNKGDYIEFNDIHKVYFKTDTSVTEPLYDYSEVKNKLDSINSEINTLANVKFKRNDFLSNNLTDQELNFLLNKRITKIKIVNNGFVRNANLNPEQSDNFRKTFNCLFRRDQKRMEKLSKKKPQ